PEVLLGGLDYELKAALADGLRVAGVPVRTEGHAFPGEHPRNICNRGASGKGVQLEFSDALRNIEIDLLMTAARAIQTTLQSIDGAS
ncbi:MAG: poly-gamma-glutamate hydrolase family protein, partial [Thiolinea sp.]